MTKQTVTTYAEEKTDGFLKKFASDLATKQKPLEKDFEKILFDNLYELLVRS